MVQKEHYPNYFELLFERINNLENLLLKLTHQHLHPKETSVSKNTLINMDEAVIFLGIPRSTLYSYISKKSIPYMKKGKRLFFYKENLLKWVEEGNSSLYSISNPVDQHPQNNQRFLKPRRKKLGGL